jgi:calcineurin-like phosphoesterase family protein
MSELITWLHISDLHCGQEDNDWMSRIVNEFCDELPSIIQSKELSYPDFILVTGDLAYSGVESEYKIFDSTILKIKKCLSGWNPTIISVPGNHDLNRRLKSENGLNIDSFKDYVSYRCSQSCACFQNCNINCKMQLVCNQLQRQYGIACSEYPGDYYWQFNLPGKFPFAILGLNSEFKESSVSDSDNIYKRLEMIVNAGEANNLNPKSVDRKVLLIHHPPSQFEKKEEIFKDINTLFGNIDICLHGHLHQSRSTIKVSICGNTEYQYQAASLCGLKKFGNNIVERSFGFGIGSISKHGEIRVWPFVREKVEGKYQFVWDRKLGEEHHYVQAGARAPGVLVRKATRPAFNFSQLMCESNKIMFTGLFYESPLIEDKNVQLTGCLNAVYQYAQQAANIEITFILPARNNLCGYVGLLKTEQVNIERHWDILLRDIRHFLNTHPGIIGNILEYGDIFPIEAIVFDDEYLVYRILGLPSGNIMQSDWNDESFGQLINAIHSMKDNSSPIMEFNIYGRYIDNVFHYDGIVPQPIWCSFLAEVDKMFPVSICLIIHNNKIVLQTRSNRNSGSDLGRVSLVASKLIEADFFCSLESDDGVEQFWNNAQDAWKNTNILKLDQKTFENISRQFSQLLGWPNGKISNEVLSLAYIKAIKRGLHKELSIDADDDRIQVVPPGYAKIIKKEKNASILISLFWIRITDDEFNQCTMNDSDIREYDVLWLNKNGRLLNSFISISIQQIQWICSNHARIDK